MATISAVRTLLRNMSRMTVTSDDAHEQVLRTVSVVTCDQLRRGRNRARSHAGQHPARCRIVQLRDLGFDVLAGRASESSFLRSRTMHCTLSSWS